MIRDKDKSIESPYHKLRVKNPTQYIPIISAYMFTDIHLTCVKDQI